MLVNVIPQLNQESVELLETVFVEIEDEENSMDNENEDQQNDTLKKLLIDNLRRTYQ